MKQQIILAILLSGVLLWCVSATKVEAPRVEYYRGNPAPVKASMIVTCEEHQRLCKARQRLEKIKKEKRDGND